MRNKGLQKRRGEAIEVFGAAPQALRILLPAYGEAGLARGLSVNTLATVERDLEKLVAYMQESELTELASLGPKHLQGFLTWLTAYRAKHPGRRGARLALSSRARIIANTRAVLHWAYRAGHLAAELSEHLPIPRVPKALPRDVPTLREIGALIRAQLARQGLSALGLRNAAALALLFACGLRRQELCALKREDVDLREREVRVVSGKGGRGRVVPLSTWARALAARYAAQGRGRLPNAEKSPFFFLQDDGQPMTGDTVYDLVKTACHEAKLGRVVPPHAFRHAFCLALLKGGSSIRAVNELAGHRKLEHTARYTRLSVEDLQRVVRKSHPLGRT